MERWVTIKNYGTIEQINGTIPGTTQLRFMKKKKHGKLTKNKKKLIMETMVIYQKKFLNKLIPLEL